MSVSRKLPSMLRANGRSLVPASHRARRTFNSSAVALQRSKDDLLDREAINTESNEHSKSGGDGRSAAQDVAFQPNLNDPKQQQKKAGDQVRVTTRRVRLCRLSRGELCPAPSLLHTRLIKAVGQPIGCKRCEYGTESTSWEG
jgi:hypothetical protein